MMWSKKEIDLFLVNITVHLDILGYSIVLPIISYLSKSLGGTELHTSLLFTGYAVTQFLSYLYMGKLSDMYGRKPMIVLSLLGSFIGAFAQGMAKTIWSLIIYRTLTGLFAGSWIVAQAYIADSTTPSERPKYIARLEAFLAAAYIFGPAIGGFLGDFSYSYPFFLAGSVAFLALLCVIFVLRESLDANHRREIAEKTKKAKAAKISKKKRERIFTPVVLLCMCVEFCNRWIINAWDSYFATYADSQFQFSSISFSILVTCLGCISCCLNGLVYPALIFKLSVPIPYISMCAGMLQIFSNIIMGASPNLVGAIIGSVVMEMGYDLSTPAPSSIISSYSDPDHQGQILSYNMMSGQIAMILSPQAMSLFSTIRPSAPFFFSSIFGIIVIVSMCFIAALPGGLNVGRITREEMELSSKKMLEAKKGEIGNDDDLQVL